MTNKLKRIGMLTSYPGSFRHDWLWNQYPNPEGIWKHTQMAALDSKPDYLLLYQFDFPKSQSNFLSRFLHKTELPFRNVPLERRIYLMREPPFSETIKTIQHNYKCANHHCAYVSGPDHLNPNPAIMPAIWYVSPSFLELNTMSPPSKTKDCSWITSGTMRTQNHRQRMDFLHALKSRISSIDIFGRGLPNTVSHLGPIDQKWNALAPYRFNLAIENFSENDLYVSEKLWDALLAWCLPIYFGGSAADRLLPSGSFIRLPSLDEEGIRMVIDSLSNPDLWTKALPAIAEARQIILHKLNLAYWLEEYLESLP